MLVACSVAVVSARSAAAMPTPDGSAAPPVAPPAVANAVPPVQVALDPSLIVAQPGDSAATHAARAALAAAQHAYAAANQRYDQAAAAAVSAENQLRQAQQDATVASADASVARADVAAMAVDLYESADPVPPSVVVMLTSSGTDVLDDLARQQQIASYQSDTTQRALDAQAVAEEAEQQVAAAQAAADAAQAAALAAQRSAAALVSSAQQAVAALHIKDLEAAAAAAAERAKVAGSAALRGQDNAVSAAALLQAQALASGAAKPADFPPHATAIATIALADRALLHKAAVLAAGNDAPQDETTVMGAPPDLGGSVAWSGANGAGPARALTPFDGTVSNLNWPSAGVGTAVPGTAPFLQTDGVNVHPVVPGYPKGYRPLRAQVAVDSALGQLGSPYVWNAAGATTFDCSGLTLWAWGHAGVALEHFTGTQVHEGVAVAPGQLLPGDLLLFGADLHHVGMYLGAGYMIDAPTTGDYVKIQLVSDMGDYAVAVRP